MMVAQTEWVEIRPRVWERRAPAARMAAMVSRLDGRNWGFVVYDHKGSVLEGKVHPDLSLDDAKWEAETALGGFGPL